jgi:hypothetical protein
VLSSEDRITIVSRALHTFHGQGYCTLGKHLPGLNFHCYDEARAILAALDGEAETSDIPNPKKALTLSARQERSRNRR